MSTQQDIHRQALALMQSAEKMREPLQAAILGSGGKLWNFTAQLDRIYDRPGANITAAYTVQYSHHNRLITDYLVAASEDLSAKAAQYDSPISVLTAGELSLSIWRHPADPALPGLASACTPPIIASWYTQGILGTEHTQSGIFEAPQVKLEVLVYRPLRRAVIRAIIKHQQSDHEQTCDTLYIKVVRPSKAPELIERHRLLTGTGPQLIATPEPGIIVTQANKGKPLSFALANGEKPTLASLLTILDRLPAATLKLPERPAWTDSIRTYEKSAIHTLPRRKTEIRKLCAHIEQLANSGKEPEKVPTHGDFYEANIFTDETCTELSLIDIDSVGPGRREDDIACLLAHVNVLPQLSAQHYQEITDLPAQWAQEAGADHDPVRLYARIAGVLISLISGTDETSANHRLECAKQWVNLAHELKLKHKTAQ